MGKYFSLVFMLLTLYALGLKAQETILATGGEALGTGGSVSYSVGQVFYTTPAGANGTVAQGVQQPYEISVISSVGEAQGISLKVSVFPNPATSYLMLRVENYTSENLNYQIFDLNGRLLKQNKLDGNETTIGIFNWPSATYLLRVTDGAKIIKTFKIIKI